MQVLTRNRRLATIAMCFVIVVFDGLGAAEDQVELARDGRACCPVIIGENASESVRDAAADLSAYLGRISSAEFVIRRGNGREGIAVGTVQDFPVLDLNQKLKGKTIADREAYLLRSHAQGDRKSVV